MTTAEICHDEARRQQVRVKQLNGLDYVEVDEAKRVLKVFFLGKAPAGIRKENVRVEGGRRIRDINVLGIQVCPVEGEDRDDCMQVFLDKLGDFSTYRLCVVDIDAKYRPIVITDSAGHGSYRPLAGFDPRYACVDFSFKAGCATDLDCAVETGCPPEVLPEPEINYLAKDYASFRQLLLDRLALIMPEWQERHVPDLGIALIEVLAYAGDQLSYYQDAVATEAYLDTARQRISVRRHARLVDYVMHEGCNARAWLCLETSRDETLQRDELSFITGRSDGVLFHDTLLTPDDVRDIPREQYAIFEPIGPQKIHLYTAHNRIPFYTWGDRECCLPRGSIAATLRDGWGDSSSTAVDQQPIGTAASAAARPRLLDHLRKGDVLIFEEILDPKTGSTADANPRHRCAVRLTRVTRTIDALYDQPVVEIEWALADALPFPVCLSAVTDAPACQYLEDISVARGNVVLVDHGRTLGRLDPNEDPYEDLGEVPTAKELPPCPDTPCPAEVETLAGPYRPHLKNAPLTYAGPFDRRMPASRSLARDPRQALPAIKLQGDPPGRDSWLPWSPRFDLLGSQANDAHYVVEINNAGRAYLRFGDGELGRQPQARTRFRARYRIGNGPGGNVGAETILYLVVRDTRYSGLTLKPRNPMPATGGIAPEPLDEVKLFAPFAFRNVLERAIIAADYAEIAARDDRVQRAAAALRWTGSWYEALVAVDPKGQVEPDAALLQTIGDNLRAYRRMGHDLAVKAAQYVALDIALTVCVLPSYLAGHVKAAVLEVLSNHRLIDGRLGFFYPDQLTFGEGVYLSKLIAVVRAVPGVENVVATVFQRYGELPNQEIDNGVIPLGPLEVARLDNDPDFPENGVLTLNMEGGR